MATERKCCIPSCNKQREDNIVLHKFPNPEKDLTRFRAWTFAIGGNLLVLDDIYIYKYRRVCHEHFESCYWLGNKMLSNIAVPTLNLKAQVEKKNVLKDITNQRNNESVATDEASTSGIAPSAASAVQVTSKDLDSPASRLPGHTDFTLLSRKRAAFPEKVKPLQKVIKKLNLAKDKYAKRLKNALNLAKNTTFQNTLKKFTTLAALFTVLQIRECQKDKMGRRFTDEEKIMGLTLYKRGPRAYRFLRKVFVLPSPVTLSRMVSRAALKPGLNENIFQQLKKRASKMKPDDTLCTLIFDEMAISPHFDYNRRSDRIIGFVNNGTQVQKIIADHVLVFMIRGVVKNYKQPISYTFCSGSTKKTELVLLIKSHISKLKSIGFKVIATVCDQGASNVSAINHLVEERRRKYLRSDAEMRHDVFEVDGEKIVPLFDVPHLLKGLRNNLLTKDLKYVMNGTERIAKWDHILKLYQNNPTYKGIRIIKKLTESHCSPDKIPKMKVKYASQIFSHTVGVNMGYLAGQGVLPQDCEHTADFILLIDNLFDSLNGSFTNSTKRSGKPLLQALTPRSAHNQLWIESKIVLKTMKFITKDGHISVVPSIRNWIRTIENMEFIRDTLFNEYDIKSIWCRHFNQDPLENFFGSIRSHGYRNNTPTCAGFEAAFASLLINNVSGSGVGNCEEDSCYTFKTLKKLFLTKKKENDVESVEIDFNHLTNDEIIVPVHIKKADPRIFAALEYVTGYILRQLKVKIFKKCEQCRNKLYKTRDCDSYIKIREYNKNKSYLTYPSDDLVACFSLIQDIVHNIIKEQASMFNIKNYIKTILYARIDLNFIQCIIHKEKIVSEILNMSCVFFLCNWCRDINKILSGTSKNVDAEDVMQILAFKYNNKRKRKYVFGFISRKTHDLGLHDY